MRIVILVLICCTISACSSAPPLAAGDLFHDELFSPAAQQIQPEDALTISEPMKSYARTRLHHSSGHVDDADRRVALYNALYRKGELRLDYDATETLTAAQAFEAKKGNCLSLVLLTAAMAKELGLPIRFQSVIGVTDWTRSDNLFMSIGHVNLMLVGIPSEFELTTWTANPMVVDFLPLDSANVLDSVEIEENTVLAMFANNRAVETLIQGNANDAYWWARAALKQDPKFANAYITLGVIYRTVHHSEYAEVVLGRVAAHDPDNTTMLTNRILVLRDLGRESESKALAQRLASLDKYPPWAYYLHAQAEFEAGHYELARHLYEKEMARDPNHHEIEYGLALVYLKLNDTPGAIKHLQRAIELSNSQQNREFYTARLEKLKSTGSI
ncbi:tetratricopeptide (TPR) repeat protein [Oxalobacteraceae bacterium GrIS 2.11]